MTTAATSRRRYWDSCNWISLIAEDEEQRADICQHILDYMVAGRALIITSALTLAEVIKRRGYPGLNESDEQTIVQFFRHPGIVVHDVTRFVAENARRLSREHGLRPNDAIHLATALMVDADVFESWNTNDYFPLRGQVPIEIREPEWEGNLEFPGLLE